MSTSLLYHAFGIKGYVYARTEYVRGEVHVMIHQPDPKLRCRACGGRRVIRKGGRRR